MSTSNATKAAEALLNNGHVVWEMTAYHNRHWGTCLCGFTVCVCFCCAVCIAGESAGNNTSHLIRSIVKTGKAMIILTCDVKHRLVRLHFLRTSADARSAMARSSSVAIMPIVVSALLCIHQQPLGLTPFPPAAVSAAVVAVVHSSCGQSVAVSQDERQILIRI